jgi:hypothetical protein
MVDSLSAVLSKLIAVPLVGQRHTQWAKGEAGRSAWEADTLPAELLPLGRPPF